MLVTFDYWLSFGKGHSGESCVEMEITDEECKRLRDAQETEFEFYECEMVADIYKRVYALADEDATNDLRAEGILGEGKRARDRYPIEVLYPDL